MIPVHYTIRAAVATDRGAIRQIVRQAGINRSGLDWRRFLVAADGRDQVIGCVQVKPHRDGSHELASLAVVPAWQRKGVAAALIAALQRDHDPPLWLTCVDRLVPFYGRFGFAEVVEDGRMPAYFRRARRLFNMAMSAARRERRLAVMMWKVEGAPPC